MKRILAIFAVLFGLSSPALAASTLEISEFQFIGVAMGGVEVQVAVLPVAPQDQVIDFTAGTVQSAALKAGTKLLRLKCMARCALRLDSGASSVLITNMTLEIGAVEYFAAPPGVNLALYKISVIASP